MKKMLIFLHLQKKPKEKLDFGINKSPYSSAREELMQINWISFQRLRTGVGVEIDEG
jgi:hypothetical protein